jgi:hypothetical protein
MLEFSNNNFSMVITIIVNLLVLYPNSKDYIIIKIFI